MVVRMKTTVEIADSLLHAARTTAARERTTVRALVEEGLRRVLEDRNGRKPFKLRKASFRGNGLQPGAGDGVWARLRELTYDGRGA
jgi:hypothetical protein